MVATLIPSYSPAHLDLSPGSLFQGRLVRGNNNTFGLLPTDKGNRCMVNGTLFVLPPEGITQQTTNPQVIDANGISTGAATVASTVYHAYLSDVRASQAPCTLRLSTVAPSTGDDGVRRLGNSDNASAWLYVGSLFMDASNVLLDVNNTRHIASWFNPQLTRAHTPIGWTGAGGPVTIDMNGQANWGACFGTIAVGQVGTLSWLDLGRDDFSCSMQGNVASTAATEWTVGLSVTVGIPSTIAPACEHQDGPVTGGVGRGFTLHYWQRANGAPALRTCVFAGRSATSTLVRFIAEGVNNGLVGAGPIGLMLSAGFMG